MGLRGISAAGFWLGLGLLAFAGSAGARAPERSLLPVQRPPVATPEARLSAASVAVSPAAEASAPNAPASRSTGPRPRGPDAAPPDADAPESAAPETAAPETAAQAEPARGGAVAPDISPSILAPSVPTFSLSVPPSETSSVTGPGIGATAALQRSPPPVPRPERNGAPLPESMVPENLASALPETAVADENPAAVSADTNPHAPALSLRPARRTAAALARFTQAARPPVQSPTTVAAGGGTSAEPTGGGLCGVSTLEGRRLSRITSPVQGCGVAEPVSVTAVAGIRLSQPATVDCDTARAFDRWVRQAMQPAMGRTGGGVTQIRIAAHYTCRPRNNRAGARVSEHGRGRAIDIAGFRLANGQTVMVLSDWHRGPHAQALQQMHASACGVFRTTLGPGSDGHHEDHFHFDMAARSNNSTYCR